IRPACRTCHADRATAGAAATDSGERIACGRSGRPHRAPPIGGQLLNPEPDRIVDDAPFWYLSRDHLIGPAGDDNALPAPPHAMNQPVPVDAAVTLPTQDLSDAPGRPRVRAALPGSRRAHSLRVQLAGDPLDPGP